MIMDMDRLAALIDGDPRFELRTITDWGIQFRTLTSSPS